MVTSDLLPLCLTAAILGAVHTLLGPDHYVPFIGMSRVGKWSLGRTLAITGLCGVGHVAGSIVIGALGIALGWGLGGIEAFEGVRGSLAGWLLFGFGLAYAAWGVHRAIRHQRKGHVHVEPGGSVRYHEHEHEGAHHGHAHARVRHSAEGSMTPWILFAIFVFGPCEPLIPVLMYPAAKQSLSGIALVTLVFAVCTIGTMMTLVALGAVGVARVNVRGAARFSHVIAGLTIAACGAAVQLGL